MKILAEVTANSNRVIADSELMSERDTNEISSPVSQEIVKEDIAAEPEQAVIPVPIIPIEEVERSNSSVNSSEADLNSRSSSLSSHSSDYSTKIAKPIKRKVEQTN